MDLNIDNIYLHYIKPLSYKERLIIARRILQDFMPEKRQEYNEVNDKLQAIRKFKGIAKFANTNINEDDWYRQ